MAKILWNTTCVECKIEDKALALILEIDYSRTKFTQLKRCLKKCQKSVKKSVKKYIYIYNPENHIV